MMDGIGQARQSLPTLCVVDSCEGYAKARGFCWRHYKRWQVHGSPTAGRGRKTPLGEARSFLEDVALPYTGDECLIWPYCRDSSGYGQINIKGRVHTVSRLVCELTIGPPPDANSEAAHSCGAGHLGCVSRNHLSWKTPRENSADRISHGTQARGETHGNAKLTDQDVLEIRRNGGALTQRELAKFFGVSPSTISLIKTRKIWAHVKTKRSSDD